LDSLTRQVIRSLQWPLGNDLQYGFRPTYWAISKKLKVPPRAIKLRIERLTSSKVISHMRVVPDVRLFGLKRTGVTVVMSDKVVEKMTEKIPLFDFLETVHVSRPFHIPSEITNSGWSSYDSLFVSFDIIHKLNSELNGRVALLKEVFGDFSQIYAAPFAPDHRSSPSVPDSRVSVLIELIRQPFSEIHQIALRTFLSDGSVRKYLRELAITRAYFFEPVIDAMKMDSIPFMVGVFVNPGERDAIMTKLKESLMGNWLLENVGAEGVGGLVCVADNLGEAERLFASLQNVKEFEGSVMVMGVHSIDNQANVSYLKRQD
jgi:DNA-binding Lrp family transcriptional regulator